MLEQTPMELDDLARRLRPPVLLVSTVVGRGMYTLGEALRERFPHPDAVEHVAVEDHLPGGAVTEDLRRYKLLADRLPFLLRLVYTIPVFYYRKYLRERYGKGTDLTALKRLIERVKPGTVVCVSHRPAFWLSNLKRREGLDFDLAGLLGEYGDTLGWKYLPWDQINYFLSPLPRRQLSYPFPEGLQFAEIELPARQDYYRLAARPGDPNGVLLVCGYWGQGPIVRVVHTLLAEAPGLRLTVICGENGDALARGRAAFAGLPNVRFHGAVPSLLPFLRDCSCVVTKPGISTLLEAHAAGRKVFLLKGMPVAEDNNARHALQHFGAEWFSPEGFQRWRHTRSAVAA